MGDFSIAFNKLIEALKEKKMDLRLRDKLLAEGKLNLDQVQDYLKTLPDEVNNLTYTDKVEEEKKKEKEEKDY